MPSRPREEGSRPFPPGLAGVALRAVFRAVVTAMTHALAAVLAPAHHLHRQGVERPLLLRAERRVEGADRIGALMERRLVLGHAVGHAVETLRRGQLGLLRARSGRLARSEE